MRSCTWTRARTEATAEEVAITVLGQALIDTADGREQADRRQLGTIVTTTRGCCGLPHSGPHPSEQLGDREPALAQPLDRDGRHRLVQPRECLPLVGVAHTTIVNGGFTTTTGLLVIQECEARVGTLVDKEPFEHAHEGHLVRLGSRRAVERGRSALD
jgi:hypothetical protein